jgi:hypothetical protein
MNIIFRFVNRPGLGDNIRGLISLLQIRDKIKPQKEINVYVDFSCSKLNRFIVNKLPTELASNIDTFEEVRFFFGEEYVKHQEIIDFLLCSDADTLIYCSNYFPDKDLITDDIKVFIKNILNFNSNFEEKLKERFDLLPETYKLYHYRLGDERFSEDKDDNSLNFYINHFNNHVNTTNIDDNCVVISDSLAFKKKIYEMYNNKKIVVYLNKPLHTDSCNYEREEDIDILIDFFLILKTKKVYCYSYYRWISNFILWSSYIFDVPLENIK